ncbi:hypothetical protein B4102_2240 [Heyndrickxia sporothermodurans]|uniref:Uncharacterized protein n=1 Tax=Heyndrickxia sporothermodurans TaxID=46224 RepID=A0A150LGA8_9BACI|nr:hypothetical protein B4102_2240 [Heyndrickxia sporothermodurans]
MELDRRMTNKEFHLKKAVCLPILFKVNIVKGTFFPKQQT